MILCDWIPYDYENVHRCTMHNQSHPSPSRKFASRVTAILKSFWRQRLAPLRCFLHRGLGASVA